MAQEQGAAARIVVGVDGSVSSKRALQWAVGQAALTGAVVEAVQAWEVPTSLGMAAVLLPAPELGAQVEQALAATVRQVAGDRPEVQVRRLVVRGHPARVLVERARGADLLVVGSHGRGGFVGTLLGSVSLHCVQHAPCPVVVVRAGT